MLEQLGNVGGLLVAVIGFGAIVFIHEMGHFLAARWAGIRVYAFAVGFGPAAIAWRKGIGLRRGSTNAETLKKLRETLGDTGESALELENVAERWPDAIGKTEYRLNWLPFGGYVHMRGQDDMSPGEASQNIAPDSFMAKPVWKRMIVISAGVVMNVLLALLLYIVVYSVGKPAPPAIVGEVRPGGPAAVAVATNAAELGVTDPGLRTGDVIVSIDGTPPREFTDLWMAGALAKAGEGVDVLVQREGVQGELRFSIPAEREPGVEFASVGVLPAISTALAPPDARNDWAELNIAHLRETAGLGDASGVMTSVNGRPVTVLPSLHDLFSKRGAEGVPAVFTDDNRDRSVTLRSVPSLERERTELSDRPVDVQHLLGLVPPMSVGLVYEGAQFGLRPGDILARIGRVEWPGPAEGIRAIRAAAGDAISLSVLRDGARIEIDARVKVDGTIGFLPSQALGRAIVTRALPDTTGFSAAAALAPGTEITSVNGAPVTSYAELRDALAGCRAGEPVELGVLLPTGGGTPGSVAVALSEDELERARALGWEAPPYFQALFAPAEITVKASNPAEAVVMGVSDTNQMIVRTYLTLIRLFEGAVEVEQLRGPVGIAHIGTQVAQRSAPELLFFFAVISANLAVLNFLPIPIADGGLMVFLLIEWVTGKPVSPAVQNGAALVGLVLLGSVFILVTFNDITRLL